MKKLLVLSAIVGCGLSVYAQGVVNFVTTGSGLRYPGWATNKVNVVGWLAGAAIPANAGIPSGTPIRAALYGGQVNDPTTFALLPSTAAGANAYATFNTAGLILGSTGGGGRVATFAGAGFAQIRAWSGNYATYEDALAGLAGGTAGFFGASSVVPATFNTPPTPPANLALGNTSFLTLEYVPEPSVLVLAALGLGSLVYLRRRK